LLLHRSEESWIVPKGTHANEPPDRGAEGFSDKRIQGLLRNADRLAFGIRPAGFVLINRARLLAAKDISPSAAVLIDEWVARAGGGLQPLRRAEPLPARKHQRRTTRAETIVWGVPAAALKQDARAT
jgi:hypothetical protein